MLRSSRLLVIAFLGMALCVPVACSLYLDDDVVCDSGLRCPPGTECTADGTACITGTCGNGIIDPWETCDDGNVRDGDGCSRTCKLDPRRCGNGVLDPGEVCDDGNDRFGDGCSADCLSDESCGNGYLDAVNGEECDDGNNVSGDGCGAGCWLELCGNGLLDPGEACDGGGASTATCDPDCTLPECGDGFCNTAAGECDAATPCTEDCPSC